MKDEEMPKDKELLDKTWDCYEVCKETTCPAWRHIHSNERLDMDYWWKIRRLCVKENEEATR